MPGSLAISQESVNSYLTIPYPKGKSTCPWQQIRTVFLRPWFPWIKTVTKGREPGISCHYYEHKPGFFERKQEENKTSCSIHCLLLRFSKTREFQSSKANWRLRFSLPSIILEDLSGNRNLLQQVQKVMVCDWWLVNFDLCCVFQCFKVRCCDCNYDWRWQKMQLWRQLLIFIVLALLKSAVYIAYTGNLKFL